MIKLIASDLDGTIIDKNNNIARDNLKAIKDITKNNIPFAICTGKTYSIYKELCSSFDANYGIFGNGSLIVDLKTGKKIYQNLLDSSTIKKIIKLAKQNNLHVHLYTTDSVITEELLYLDLRNYKLQKKHIYDSELKFNIVPNILNIDFNTLEVSKIVISSTSSLENLKLNILDKINNVDILSIKKYGEFRDTIINKEYEYLDIMPKDVNKGTALQFLSNYLQIDKKQILAIGDNLNDLNMLKNAGIGVAVNNAYSELKEIANFTTNASVEKGAFAEAIYKFIKF